MLNHLCSITNTIIFITIRYKTYKSEQKHTCTPTQTLKIMSFSDIFLKEDQQK